MIDAHCHLHDERFDADREEMIRRALEGGVKRMLLIGTDIGESKKAIALAEKYEEMRVAVGVHPHFFNQRSATRNPRHTFQRLEELLQHPKVVGIGEVGLDYYSHTGERITEKQKENQKLGFLAQMELARKYNLPLVIHTRPSSRVSDDAYLDLLDLITCRSSPVPCNLVLHSYQGSVSMTEKFLALPNVYFSFAGYITYPVRKDIAGGQYDIRESIKMIPLDRILTETDSPYLAPQSVRGTRNEPAYVRYVVEEIAKLKDPRLKESQERIQKNFEKVLEIPFNVR